MCPDRHQPDPLRQGDDARIRTDGFTSYLLQPEFTEAESKERTRGFCAIPATPARCRKLEPKLGFARAHRFATQSAAAK